MKTIAALALIASAQFLGAFEAATNVADVQSQRMAQIEAAVNGETK